VLLPARFDYFAVFRDRPIDLTRYLFVFCPISTLGPRHRHTAIGTGVEIALRPHISPAFSSSRRPVAGATTTRAGSNRDSPAFDFRRHLESEHGAVVLFERRGRSRFSPLHDGLLPCSYYTCLDDHSFTSLPNPVQKGLALPYLSSSANPVKDALPPERCRHWPTPRPIFCHCALARRPHSHNNRLGPFSLISDELVR